MLTLKIVSITGLLVVVISLFTKNRFKKNSNPPGLIVLGILVTTGSLFWLGYESTRLSFNLETRDWENIQGVIISSRVSGNRAIHPEIVIKYTMRDLTRTFTTDLFAPGFGVRSNRRDQAEKLVAEYHPGDSVLVHVNPENILQARLHVGPTWDNYIRLTLSAFSFAFGFWLILFSAHSLREKRLLSTGSP